MPLGGFAVGVFAAVVVVGLGPEDRLGVGSFGRWAWARWEFGRCC